MEGLELIGTFAMYTRSNDSDGALDNTNLGTEFDLEVRYTYSDGIDLYAIVGVFSPGKGFGEAVYGNEDLTDGVTAMKVGLSVDF